MLAFDRLRRAESWPAILLDLHAVVKIGRGSALSERSLLLQHAVIARVKGDASIPERADILIRGQRIAAIERPDAIDRSNAAEVVDASRLVVLPGMINGHMHSWDHYLKGLMENLTTEIFMAQIRPRRPVPLTPRQIYLRTMIGAIESLHTGATALVDDLSLGQVFSPEHVEAALQAYEDSGTRALVGLSMIDKPVVDSYPFVDELFPTDLLAELRGLPRPAGEQLIGVCRDLAVRRHPKERRVGLIISPSAPHRCTDPFLQRVRALADEFDLPLMTHCQETRLQIITGQELYGESLVAHLDRLGFLKPKTTLIHGCWMSRRDLDLIAKAGVAVQYNAWSNLVTGSGVAPIREMLDAGINVSMGTDGTGITFGVNMLGAVGTGATLQKIRQPDHRRWTSGVEMFVAATYGSARALGLEGDLGALEVGKRADLVCYSMDTHRLTPLNDPIRQVIHGERGSGVEIVLVDGEVVVRNGRLTRIDETALLREAQDVHAELKETIAESLGDAGAVHRRADARLFQVAVVSAR